MAEKDKGRKKERKENPSRLLRHIFFPRLSRKRTPRKRKPAAKRSGWSEGLGAALGGKHINSHEGTAPSQGPDWAGGGSRNADIQRDGGGACAAPPHLSSDKLLTPNRILTGFRGLELSHDEPTAVRGSTLGRRNSSDHCRCFEAGFRVDSYFQ